MEVRPGYKLTEVGVIPEEWEVKPLGELASSIGYGSSAKSAQVGLVPVLRMGNLQDGKIDWTNLVYTSDSNEIEKYLLSKKDILFNRTNTIDLVGKSSIYTSDLPAIFAGYLIRVKVNQKQYSAEYLNYILNTSVARKYSLKVLSLAVGQANINGEKLKTYPIPIPPTLPEQAHIAEALSDVDDLINSLDQLIAKKRDIKQAAMQQLLTGKMRLPGFHDAWIILTAGEIGKFHGGCGFPIQWQGKHNGTYPFFKVSDMNNDGNEVYMTAANNYISESVQRRLGANIFPQSSIVLAKVGAAIFLERKKILGQPSCIDNNMTAYVMDTQRVDVRFIHALLLLTRLGDLVSTTALPSINGKQLSGISISLPSLHEQKAIVAILSEMDTELAVLEHRRDKTKLLKQAMMQELLTGRIRLV